MKLTYRTPWFAAAIFTVTVAGCGGGGGNNDHGGKQALLAESYSSPIALTSDGANGGLGINIPSLMSVFASAPYFHSGAAQTLDETLENVSHRTLGIGADTLSTVTDRAKVVKFLKSIDLTTPTFPEKTMNEAKTLCLP